MQIKKHPPGTRFGHWTVLGAYRVGKANSSFLECQCVCGRIRWVQGARLRAKRKPSTSCGCMTPQKRKAVSQVAQMIEIKGESRTVEQWAADSPVTAGTIYYRLRKGWQPEQAVFAQKGAQHPFDDVAQRKQW